MSYTHRGSSSHTSDLGSGDSSAAGRGTGAAGGTGDGSAVRSDHLSSLFGASGEAAAPAAGHDDPFTLHLGGAVQRAAEGSGEIAIDAATHVEHAAAGGGGSPLPAEAKGRFEQSLGTDLSDVRLHTDSAAATAADAVDAKAYTLGQDIYFGSGFGDLSAPGGAELLAHEVAHTVQQRDTSAAQFKFEVSQPGDMFEVEADVAAGAMMTGAPASVSPLGAGIFRKIMRDPRGSHHGAEHVGGGETPGVSMMNQQGTAEIDVGDAGYSRQMLRSTAELAGHIGDLAEVQNILVQPQQPDMTGLDRSIAVRQNDVERMQKWIDDESGFFGHHQSKVHATSAHGWVERHMQTLVQDKDNIQQKFVGYNAWCPEANAFYASLTRMQAQMNLLGIGSNLTEMVAALRREIGAPAQEAQPATADQPAQAAQAANGANAVGARAVDRGTPLPVPPTDDTVTQAGMEANAAFRSMQTSYIGLQQNFHAQTIQDVNATGEAARQRLQEINEIKAFIHQVGATIDTTAAVVNGAPAALANATEFVQRGGAQLGAMRNRRAMMRGEAERWNPTYTTIGPEGNLVVRNMQTGMDLDPTIAPGAEGRSTPSPGGGDGGLTIPTSIGGAMDAIADFAYKDEVQRLNQHLHAIEARCTAERVASEFLETVRKVREYKDALNLYAVKANHLQQRMAERRAQYLRFGEQMDQFAARDRATQRAGEAPGRGRERYATVFALVAAVREAIAMGRIAAGSNPLGDRAAIRAWFNTIQDHRTDNGRPTITGFGRESSIRRQTMPQGEIDAIDAMASGVLTFGVRSNSVITQLMPVEEATQGLMSQLHEGGGSHAY